MSAQTVLLLHSSGGHYGADRQLALIAGGLDRERFTPLVVLPDSSGPLASDLARLDVEVITRPLAMLAREARSPIGLSRLSAQLAADATLLRHLIRSRKVALVHSNGSSVLSGAVAAQAAGVPHIWHVREIFSSSARLWPLHRRLLSSAAALPCVSVASSLQFGGAEPVRVIHDGLAIAPVRSQRAVARGKLALPHHRPVIATVGRISDGTGQDLLIRALADEELTRRGAIGLVAGDVRPGAEHRRESLVELARELGVGDRLVMGGFIEPVADVYGAADVIAVASRAPEPLPGSAIEAAAAGCAVVGAAHGGLPEIISDGRTGVLFPPGDAHALAAALGRLIDQPRLRATLGATASQDVRKRFARERLLTSLQALYSETLRK